MCVCGFSIRGVVLKAREGERKLFPFLWKPNEAGVNVNCGRWRLAGNTVVRGVFKLEF
jgi:hypothetical protein